MMWSSASSTRTTHVASSMRCATRLEEFALSLHPDKTRLIEFGRHAAADRKQRGLGKPETFAFLGFTFICGKSRRGQLPASTEDPTRPHAGEAPGDQGGAAAANAPADPRTGEMAEAGRDRPLRLLRGPDEQPGALGVPALCDRPLAAHASAAQPEGRLHVGSHDEAGQTTGSPSRASFIPGQTCASPSDTRGRSRVPESGSLGSVRGAPSNGRPYRDVRQAWRVVREHRLVGVVPDR